MSLTFDEPTHTYRFGGVVVPSVTQILRPLYDFSRVSEEVLAAKGELGTAVHLACELDDAGDLVEESVHEQVRPYLEGYRLFKRQKLPTVLATELRVYHPTHGYAGTLDLLADFDAARWLIDWKTPLVINPAVALQTAAYAATLPQFDARAKRAALQLKADGTFKLHEFKDPNDFPVFLGMLATHRWKERHCK